MSPKRITVPDEQLALYRRLLESTPGVAERSHFGSAYTAVNGNMYSIRRDEVEPRRERFEFT